MDSKSRDLSGETIVFPVRKDETDSFLAYREGVKRGYRDFVLLGGEGGREDHTFANISLLLYAKTQGHSIKMIGKQNDYSVILDGADTFLGEALSHLSVFALGGIAEGVTIQGAEYEAENITLSPEYPLGASNRFLDKPVTVSVERGALLIITENRAPQN
jgi:thiamine pyrophosphokinase